MSSRELIENGSDLGFFGGALVVEVDEALEVFFFGFSLVFGLFLPGGGGAGATDEFLGQFVPAVGLEDIAVEFVVQLAQDGDQALFVDVLVLGTSVRLPIPAFRASSAWVNCFPIRC